MWWLTVPFSVELEQVKRPHHIRRIHRIGPFVLLLLCLENPLCCRQTRLHRRRRLRYTLRNQHQLLRSQIHRICYHSTFPR